MSDDLQITVVPEPGIVAVPQPDIDILVDERVTPIVVESIEAEVVVVDEDFHVVDEVRDIQVVTVGEVGPPGPGGGTGFNFQKQEVGALETVIIPEGYSMIVGGGFTITGNLIVEGALIVVS